MNSLKSIVLPTEQNDLGDGCLEGTRINILKEVRGWLQDGKEENKILWIVGDPGTGKSTVATTIAKELSDKAPFVPGSSAIAMNHIFEIPVRSGERLPTTLLPNMMA